MSLLESRYSLGFKAALCAALLAVSGCAHAPQGEPYATVDEDPLEPVNRAIFQFNYALDGAVIKPVTQIYRGITPEKGQEMVSNFIDNMYMPITFFNSVLQGDPENSFSSLWSFILNTTWGIGGVFDVASETDLKVRKTDFGETLAMYGAGRGAYVVLPLIGPSSTRDSIGRLADAFMSPVSYADEPWPYIAWGATVIERRSENMELLDDIYRTSLDPYSTFRSGYLQKRESDVRRAMRSRKRSLEKAGF
ncbi:MAG: VacJ family lipoprotein [Rickettsiales bacterium]